MSTRKSEISQTPADRTKPHHRGVLFMEGLPLSTKAEFKACCARNGQTMRDAIITLMREYIHRIKGTGPRRAWIIDNGKEGQDKKYLGFSIEGWEWMGDKDAAIQFSRRRDAEAVARDCEEAESITEHQF